MSEQPSTDDTPPRSLRPAQPIERAVGIDYYVSDVDGIGGRLRASPSDFRVQELEAFDPAPLDADPGSYPELVVRVILDDWDTNDFARRVADALEMSRERVSWAGTKDKRAVTTQLFTLRNVDPSDLPTIRGVEMEPIGRAGRGLQFGDLAGNAFEIRVAEAVPEAPDRVGAILESLQAFTGRSTEGPAAVASGQDASGDATEVSETTDRPLGVPNYFGQQRFGSRRPVTHTVGLAVVRGDWREAVRRYAGNPAPSEPADTRAARSRVDDAFGTSPNPAGEGPAGSAHPTVDSPAEPTQPRETPEPTQPLETPEPTQPRGTPEPTQPRGTPEPTQPRGTPEPTQPRETPEVQGGRRNSGADDDLPSAVPSTIADGSGDGEWAACLEALPAKLRFERSMVHRLDEGGVDPAAPPDDEAWRHALEAVPSNLQRLFVNAAQSFLFNRILSERLRRGLPFGRPVAGDVVCFADRDAPAQLYAPDTDRIQRVDADRVDVISRHCERDRAFVTAPLVGTETDLADGTPGDIERSVLEQVGIEASDFDRPDAFGSTGTRRAILLRTDLGVAFSADDPTFSFALPSGSYATVVLREFLKRDPRDL